MEMGSDEIGRLRLVFLRLARNIRSHSVDDITPSQLAVLSSIVRHGPSTVGQIADHEHVQAPSASRIVAALEQRGLVERATDPADRRCATISISPAGDAHVEQIRTAGASWLADRLDGLPTDDRALIVAALPALERLLERAE